MRNCYKAFREQSGTIFKKTKLTEGNFVEIESPACKLFKKIEK